MTFPDVVSYYLALLTIAFAPGPVLLLLMTRAASNDIKGAIGFAVGAAFGSLAIISAVCFGLSVWMADVPGALGYSKFLMLAYILWVARGMWRGGPEMNATLPAPAKMSACRSGPGSPPALCRRICWCCSR